MSEDQTFVLKPCGSEVDKQASLKARCFEVVDNLGLFHARELLKGFQFHYDLTITNKVCLVFSDYFSTIRYRQTLLSLKRNSLKTKFTRQGCLVNRLKKPVPQFPMNRHGCPDDLIGLSIPPL